MIYIVYLTDRRDDLNVTEVITHNMHFYEARFIALHHSTQKVKRRSDKPDLCVMKGKLLCKAKRKGPAPITYSSTLRH